MTQDTIANFVKVAMKCPYCGSMTGLHSIKQGRLIGGETITSDSVLLLIQCKACHRGMTYSIEPYKELEILQDIPVDEEDLS